MILLAYFAWIAVALTIFAIAPRRYAPWLSPIGGWVLLPPGVYPESQVDGFTFWILGGSLPSNVLMSKAWVAPAATCIASLVFDFRRWISTPLRLWDIPIALFCLWPIIQNAIVGDASPAGWTSALYLAGSWALPWWLGRVYLKHEAEFEDFALILIGATLLLIPIAIFEGLSAARIHTIFYGEHPYAANGVERYLGFRPQAFFENGNQYGIWCAAAAVAGYWLVKQGRLPLYVAAILAVMTIISQSAGAIALMAFGLVALTWSGAFSFARRYAVWALLAAVFVAALLLTGLVPLREFILHNPVGQALLDVIRSTGRGSFAWRISQDMKAAPLLREHLILGHGVWDWFMAMNSRPWGFPFLVVGQFGLVGLSLLSFSILRSLVIAFADAADENESARLAAVVITIAGLDALLNSFLFWPFITLAGGMCAATMKTGGETNVPAKETPT